MGRNRVADFIHAGAFATMSLVGEALDKFSFSLRIYRSLGILVDDAIVVGESVYTLGSKGEKSLNASIKDTHLVAMPMLLQLLPVWWRLCQCFSFQVGLES